MTRVQMLAVPGRGLAVERKTAKVSVLTSPNGEQILFHENIPIAAYDGAYVYQIEGSVKSMQAAVNSHWPGVPCLLQDTTTFEFTLGQIMSKAGLMLVRRPSA